MTDICSAANDTARQSETLAALSEETLASMEEVSTSMERILHHIILANAVQLAGHVHIGDWAVIGGITGVHQYVRVGAHAMAGF